MELLYTILNASVIPAWVLIVFFPKSEWTNKFVFSYAWHIALSVFYLVYIVWGSIENFDGKGGMHSLEALRIGFGNDKVLLAAWAHYLIFDLFVGVWIVKDAQSKNINSWLLKPILLFTLILGPLGFLFYKLFLKFRN